MINETYELYKECPVCGKEHEIKVDYNFTPGDPGNYSMDNDSGPYPATSAEAETDLPRVEPKSEWRMVNYAFMEKIVAKLNKLYRKIDPCFYTYVLRKDGLDPVLYRAHRIRLWLAHKVWVRKNRLESWLENSWPVCNNYVLPCGHECVIDGEHVERDIVNSVED